MDSLITSADCRPQGRLGIQLRDKLIEPGVRPLQRGHRARLTGPQALDALAVTEQHVGETALLATTARKKVVNPGEEGIDEHDQSMTGNFPQCKTGMLSHENSRTFCENFGMTLRLKTPTSLAERVKKRLDDLDMSALAASKAAGMSESFVRDILRLRVRSPGATALATLARVLQCSVDYLLGQADDVGAPPPEGTVLPAPGQFQTAPLLIAHDVAAGRWNEVDDLLQVEPEQSPLASDPQWPHVDQYACRVVGPSMNEFYPPGSFVRLVSIHALRGYMPATGDHVEVVRRRDGGSLLEFTLKEVVVTADGAIELVCRSTDPKFAGTKIPYRDGVSPDAEGAEVSIRGLVTGDFRPRPVRR